MIKPFDQLMQLNRKPKRSATMSQSHLPNVAKTPTLPEKKDRNKGYFFDINSLFIFLMVIGIGIALRTLKEWQLTEKRAILAEAGKTLSLIHI